jgi:succinate dehydrogenase flavin-adding protein (antitoxin of CptAB toxin-antitoxin module)
VPYRRRSTSRRSVSGSSRYSLLSPLREADLQLKNFLEKERDKICLEIAASTIQLCSEFTIGVMDEEDRFREDWEGGQMRKVGVEDEVAKVWLDEGRGLICARFAFKREAVDEIRSEVPKGKKNWNPDLKIWEFSVEALETVVSILSKHFQRVVDLTRETPTVQSSNGADQLLSLVDQEDAKKIYRLLAIKYHPDRGGSSEVMAKINQVFSKFGKQTS